ncbi:MAG: hypothetical protein VYC34_02770 [Planctomycetota bacterium]|nr:hypothetical protein [Planctomycetota bacterium]
MFWLGLWVVACSAGWGCDQEAPLGNGVKLVRIDSDTHCIMCEADGKQVSPVMGWNYGQVRRDLERVARVGGSTLMVAEYLESEQSDDGFYEVIDGCMAVAAFRTKAELEAHLEALGLYPPVPSEYLETRVLLSRGGWDRR